MSGESSERDRLVDLLRQWSRLLDSAYRVPGTQFRFGWDPVIGLVPGAGELVSTAFGAAILYKSLRLRVPRVVQLRMVLNLLVDLGVGAVPVIGDLFDFVWKSNDMNLALLLRYTTPGTRPSRADWAFVLAILGTVGVAAVLVAVGVGWVFYQGLRFLS
jgi:hypothetical protein